MQDFIHTFLCTFLLCIKQSDTPQVNQGHVMYELVQPDNTSQILTNVTIVMMPLYPPHISHGLIWDCVQDSSMSYGMIQPTVCKLVGKDQQIWIKLSQIVENTELRAKKKSSADSFSMLKTVKSVKSAEFHQILHI
jgi:hypothetical protein